MKLLAQLNFARFVILASFVGSMVLGYLLWVQTQELTQIDRTLRQAPVKVQGLQAQAMQVKDLMRQATDEGLGRQSDPEQYIRETARESSVNIGQVTPTPQTKEGQGYEDTHFTIKPARSNTRTFSLGAIANYAYRLEEKSRRVRVTEIQVTPTGRKLREHEILPDEWTFTLKMTTREKVD
ncbi:MAG: hypothetical protein ACYSWX_00945 [Planctomycetota bacterium]|jgi:hypothetical protein